MSLEDPGRWRVLSEHLDRALEMLAAERKAWLADLRARDAALASDLEGLLAARSQSSLEGFLEGPSPLPEAATLAGQTLGHYVLASQIGQGGMGSVWLAKRSDGRFEGMAAVKLLNASLIGRAGEERFRREGNILARLADPHIARLLDAGVSPSGQPYLVLEYVEGEPIDRFCDLNALDLRERLRLFRDVLKAVSHAHANLIVHRDIKPSNVLVDGNGQVKLLDFGIAKLLEREGQAGDETAVTRAAGRALTPEFAAPEQVAGGAVTTATDVYALGVLLYVLLTGRHPADGSRQSPAELLRFILEREPERPSTAVAATRDQAPETLRERAAARATTPDALHRQLRGDLDTIVAKALKKNPAERYASVTALAEDVRRYLRNEPIRARPDTLGYRAAKFVRRNRGGVAAAVLVMLAAVAGAAGILWKAREARRERDVAQAELARATAATDFLGFLLSVAAPGEKKFSVGELLEQGEGLIDKQFSDNDALRAEMLTVVGERYYTAEQFDKAEPLFRRAAALARRSHDSALQARALCPLAITRLARGKRAMAETMIAGALAGLPNDPRYALPRASCLSLWAEFGFFTDEGEPMIRNAQAALDLLDKSPLATKPARIEAQAALAYGYYLTRQNTRADAAYARVVKSLEQAGLENTVAAADTFNNWGLVYYQSDMLKAEPLFRKCMELHRSVEGASAGPTSLQNYAGVLFGLARYAEAMPFYEAAIRSARDRKFDREEIDSALELADLYVESGDPARASGELAEFDHWRQSPRLGVLRRAHFAYSWGLLELDRGHGEKARDLFAESLGDFEKWPARISLNVLAYTGLSRAERSMGHLEAAEAAARKGLALAATFVEPGAPSYLSGLSLLELGETQLSARRPEARETLAKAEDHLQRTLGDGHPKTLRARRLLQAAKS